MQLIEDISNNLKDEIIAFLYKNELMNVLTLHYFENKIEEIGELYVSYNSKEMDALMHIRDDGNSHFTTFYATNDKGLKKISNQITKLPYKDTLLAGSSSDVKQVMRYMGNKSDIIDYSYYKHTNLSDLIVSDSMIRIRKARRSDTVIVGDLLISFFEANTKEAKDKIRSKIDISKIRLFEKDNSIVGFGSFFGYSKNYIDISSVYIKKAFRGKGYGKQLMHLMIKEAKEKGKTAILQADVSNDAANSIYTSVGFEKTTGYTFKFVNDDK